MAGHTGARTHALARVACHRRMCKSANPVRLHMCIGFMYVRMCVCMHVYVYVYVYVYVCMYVCMYVYLYVCVRVYVCMYMCQSINVKIHVYVSVVTNTSSFIHAFAIAGCKPSADTCIAHGSTQDMRQDGACGGM